MFTFVYYEEKNIPKLKQWRYKVSLDDFKDISKSTNFQSFFNEVIEKYFNRFVKDQHLFDQTVRPRCEVAELLHPRKIFSDVYKNIIESVLQGKTLLFNQVGGYIVMNDNIRILKEIKTETFEFPDMVEIITISKYMDTPHYYLSSNMLRSFNPIKYNSYEKARKKALEYVKEEQIKYSLKPPIREGD